MNPLAALALLVLGVVVGRFTRRRRIDSRMQDWRLWLALSGFAAAFGLVVSINAFVGQNGELRDEAGCRAELAVPVNEAIARITVGHARGLVVTVDQLLDDPELSETIRQNLGDVGEAELRRQVAEVLDASDDLEAANEARGNPVEKCG